MITIPVAVALPTFEKQMSINMGTQFTTSCSNC